MFVIQVSVCEGGSGCLNTSEFMNYTTPDMKPDIKLVNLKEDSVYKVLVAGFNFGGVYFNQYVE